MRKSALLQGIGGLGLIAAMGLGPRDRVLSDLYTHLDSADGALQRGSFEEAMAHADAVLFRGSIRYSIRFDGVSEDQQNRCREALRRATALWEAALEGDVTFSEVGDPLVSEVDIVCMPEIPGRPNSAGNVQWQRWVEQSYTGEYHAMLHVDLSLRTRRPRGGNMTVEHMTHAAAHELGHVLGLEDSDHQGDLMGPLNLSRPVSRPSHDEVEALLDVRRRAFDIRRQSLLSVLVDSGGYNVSRAAY